MYEKEPHVWKKRLIELICYAKRGECFGCRHRSTLAIWLTGHILVWTPIFMEKPWICFQIISSQAVSSIYWYVRDKAVNVELRTWVDPRNLAPTGFAAAPLVLASCEVQPGEIRFWGSSSREGHGHPWAVFSILKHFNILAMIAFSMFSCTGRCVILKIKFTALQDSNIVNWIFHSHLHSTFEMYSSISIFTIMNFNLKKHNSEG